MDREPMNVPFYDFVKSEGKHLAQNRPADPKCVFNKEPNTASRTDCDISIVSCRLIRKQFIDQLKVNEKETGSIFPINNGLLWNNAPL